MLHIASIVNKTDLNCEKHIRYVDIHMRYIRYIDSEKIDHYSIDKLTWFIYSVWKANADVDAHFHLLLND